ncbi:MAG: hypothetical protein HY608_09625 [Planctomycetes bacterium]|nr:hypothetical protein [Planctomycetota bacterium]
MADPWPQEYAFVDCEATGLAPEARLIEVAVTIVRVARHGDRIEERWSSLADPGIPIPPGVSALTGIRDADVAGTPPPGDAAREALRRAGGRRLLAWNAQFDAGLLSRELGEKVEILDAIEVAQLLFPDAQEFNLPGLALSLGVPAGGHRAMADCEASVAVLDRLLQRARGRGLADDLRTLEAIYAGTEWPWLAWIRARLEGAAEPMPAGAIEPGGTGDRQPPDAFLDQMFAGDGLLARRLKGRYEPRPGQVEYAREVEKGMREARSLMIEGPTGIGKGLGYLAPAVAWALRERRRVLVSTDKLVLQDQLCRQDLPLLAAASGLGFRWAVLKGRRNYVCPAAIRAQIENLGLLSPIEDRDALAYLALFARHTQDGETERIARAVKHRRPGVERLLPDVVAGEGPCIPGRCKDPRCFLTQALRMAATADILVSNHTLTLCWPDSYPSWDAVVFDEGHTLEDAATNALTSEITSAAIRDTAVRLIGRTGKEGLAGAAIRAGGGRGASEEVARAVQSVRAAAQALSDFTPPFAEAVAAYVREWNPNADELGPRALLEASIDPARRASPSWERLGRAVSPLGDLLSGLESDLGQLLDTLEGEGRNPGSGAVGSRLAGLLREVSEMRRILEGILTPARGTSPVEEACYLAASRGAYGALRAVPVSVAGLIHQRVLARCPAIVTSATLTLPSDPDYVARRIGFDRLPPERRLPTRAFPSPYRPAETSLTLVATDAPSPEDAEAFAEHTSDVAAGIARILGGRTMILVAARARIERVADRLRRRLEGDLITVLTQNDGGRANLIARMREDRRTVLIGARSFWEGVDIPGAALSAVVLERIPFEFPHDPVVQARRRAERDAGRDEFVDYTLPRALLLLRQGAGRLLRSHADRGVVFLLDARFLKKGYRDATVQALPGGRILALPLTQALQAAERFLQSHGLVRPTTIPP